MNLLESTIARIAAPDQAASEAARQRQDTLTKPRGSLGELETLSIRIAGITGAPRPRLEGGAVFLMAGDHGICAKGVSAFPQEVTLQMLENILAGGAGINVIARCTDARVVVADIGIAALIAGAPGLYLKKVRRGTADFSEGPAMSREEATRAIEAGIEVFEAERERAPFSIAATGELGIGNTTPAAAMASVFTGASPRDITGRGTGIDDEGLARKIAAIERGIALNKPDAHDPLGVLSAVGGLEIGAIAGSILAAAAHRIPIIVDGFISSAGALLAQALCPSSAAFMIGGHLSGDRGHGLMLEGLGLKPVLSLGMRLGEGTGAVLAMGVCRAACRILDEMATFGEAGVSDKS